MAAYNQDMGSVWLGRPCQQCGGKKGKKFAARKYCYRCSYKVKAEQSRGAHAKAIEKRYGITADEYNRLYELQGGRCAMCLVATGKTRRLSVDHDHLTGKVRGLLCRPCNTLLGHARDDPDFFRRAVHYLEYPPWEQMNANDQDH